MKRIFDQVLLHFHLLMAAKADRLRADADAMAEGWPDGVPPGSFTAQAIDLHRALADVFDALAKQAQPDGVDE